jgi:hypothetical protein
MRRISKAIAGFLVPAAVILGEAVVDDKHGDLPTQGEWLFAICAAIITFGGVYAAPKNQE